MSDDPETSPRIHWRIMLVAGVFALYVFAYFPALSYIVRHPEYQRSAAAWRPIPSLIRHGMFRVWSKLDPAGLAIVESQLAAHQMRTGMRE